MNPQLKPFLCDYADVYLLVTEDITVTNGKFLKIDIHLLDQKFI